MKEPTDHDAQFMFLLLHPFAYGGEDGEQLVQDEQVHKRRWEEFKRLKNSLKALGFEFKPPTDRNSNLYVLSGLGCEETMAGDVCSISSDAINGLEEKINKNKLKALAKLTLQDKLALGLIKHEDYPFEVK